MSWIGDESRQMLEQVFGWLYAVAVFSFIMWLVELKLRWKRR